MAYYGNLTINDNAGKEIGGNVQWGFLDVMPFSTTSALPWTLDMDTVNKGRDVQFKYADITFKSTDKKQNDRGWCDTNAWVKVKGNPCAGTAVYSFNTQVS